MSHSHDYRESARITCSKCSGIQKVIYKCFTHGCPNPVNETTTACSCKGRPETGSRSGRSGRHRN